MRGVTRRLGVEADSKGFCFAVLEGTERLIDWGGREVKGGTSIFIDRLRVVIDRYRPDVLVLEDAAGSRKSQRVREWLVWMEEYAHDRQLTPKAVHQDDFREHVSFYGETRHDLAVGLARLFPELASLVPPPRKSWQSERRRMGVFLALGRTLMVAQERQDVTAGR